MSEKISGLFQLELNEINFDFIRKYNELGYLPNFKRLIEQHGIIETTSEIEYHEIEPWIQWVTVHTGLTLQQHQVFRLGDIVDREIVQIWEWLEARGVSVSATCPMNAKNRTRQPAFFLPDPWTNTITSGSPLLHQAVRVIQQAVNENSKLEMSINSLAVIAKTILKYFNIKSYKFLLKNIFSIIKGKKWAKALILDQILSEITISEVKSKNPKYATLFLNAGAHIQHHYLFNSKVYRGQNINPIWLINKIDDPVLDVYIQYDKLIGKILKELSNYRLLILTAIHQDPYDCELYYWRIRDHAGFLENIGCKNFTVTPRMSRDFLIETTNADDAIKIAYRLEKAIADDGQPLFDVDNRGKSLFVMFTYPSDISPTLGFSIEGEKYSNLRERVNFVAIKNGSHNGTGYLIDTSENSEHLVQRKIELRSMPARVAAHFELDWQ
jgi:hypothetical protein